MCSAVIFCCQAEDGIRDLVRSRGLGDVYKRQAVTGEDSHPIPLAHAGHAAQPMGHVVGADVQFGVGQPQGRRLAGIYDSEARGRIDRPTAQIITDDPVSYTHLRAHETVLDLVCRLLLEKKKMTQSSVYALHIR